MARQIVGLEWHIGEEAYTNGALLGHNTRSQNATTATQAELQFALRLGRWLICFFLACGLASSTAISAQQQARNDATSNVYAWLDLEKTSWQSNDKESFEALLDPGIPSNWRSDWKLGWAANPSQRDDYGITVDSLSVEDGVIRVVVTNARPASDWWRSSPYRETRYFRQKEESFLRTVPGPKFWGETFSIESPHVRIEFKEPDRLLAHAIINRLERAYLDLHAALEVDPDADGTKATIAITADLPRGWASVRRRQSLTSPQLAKIPIGLTDEDFMMQQIVGRFSYMVLNDAMPDTRRSYLTQWETIVWALDGWLRADVLEQKTPWHFQAEELVRANPPTERPVKLAEIGPWNIRGAPQQKELMQQYIITESIIDYLVETYGREQIPQLINAITRHSNWSDLLLAVYGVPIDSVEAGWNAYLEERFQWTATE